VNHLPPTAARTRSSATVTTAARARRGGGIRVGGSSWTRSWSDGALRLLLVGDGLAFSSRHARRRLAPAAELARSVRAITGVDCAVQHTPSTHEAAALVDLPEPATPFSAAIVAVGTEDALRLTPVAEWGARLVDLLNAVQAMLPEGAPVLLVGVGDVHVPDRVRSLSAPALRHAERLDRVARRLASLRPGVVHLAAPRLGSLAGRRPSGELVSAFALPLAAAVASALRDAGIARTGVLPDRFDRDEVRGIVEAADESDRFAIQALVERTAAEFGVPEALVSLFDGKRRWRVTSTGLERVEAERALTCCETVVATGEELVVEDAAADPRFIEHAYLHLAGAEFYAGVPLHGEDGTPIGALCLLDRTPRDADSVDLDRLRERAHAVEAIVIGTAGRRETLPVG
jgi:hypothetical protein